MSKPHPLAGLIANYGDSDDDSDDGLVHTSNAAADKQTNKVIAIPGQGVIASHVTGIHPAPIVHCPWSACYDDSSGFTYYWNHKTNAVTWEAPPEYLLALKIAQQHLHTSGSAEVSAEEWQLYQQALTEKQNSQNKMLAKAAIAKASTRSDKSNASTKEKKTRGTKKRPASDDDEKIELITSYHNSESESNDELDSSAKAKASTIPKAPKIPKMTNKKLKKPQVYGPTMSSNTNYLVPIGPELPPNIQTANVSQPQEVNTKPATEAETKKATAANDCNDSQEEGILLKRLKDQAKLLEKLGGELPSELQQMIKGDSSTLTSPKSEDGKIKSLDIDDLLQEIEQKEFAKVKKSEASSRSNLSSAINSPKSDGNRTPPLEELKALFPSAKIVEPATSTDEAKPPSPQKLEKKENIYLMDSTEPVENINRKRLRISNSVLPERKTDMPVYTTRYANEGSEKTGLGFSKDEAFKTGLGFNEEEEGSPREIVNYGNGLIFTKGGTLNGDSETVQPAEPNEVEYEDESQMLETRLSQLCEMQPAVVPQLHKMLIQLQTLLAAQREGALGGRYVASWAKLSLAALAPLEAAATAPPPGWTCSFHRCLGRYRYRRESDGLQQSERPALDNTDMDISTTPPHPGHEAKVESPKSPVAVPPPPPSPPPPPKWPEPPPPGCDEPPPLPPEPPVIKEIGDELMSFYNDIAELEKGTTVEPQEASRDKDNKPPKKKSKVKISTSMGMKHKSVSNMVAKWQQVAEEINSD